MKGKVVLLVDGENISYRRAGEICALGRRLGKVALVRVYHRQKDPATRPWTLTALQYGFQDICLYGEARKNKVDEKLMRDARKYAGQTEIGTICVASSDSDFAALSTPLRESGKRLCFFGEAKAPERLRRAGRKFVQLGS